MDRESKRKSRESRSRSPNKRANGEKRSSKPPGPISGQEKRSSRSSKASGASRKGSRTSRSSAIETKTEMEVKNDTDTPADDGESGIKPTMVKDDSSGTMTSAPSDIVTKSSPQSPQSSKRSSIKNSEQKLSSDNKVSKASTGMPPQEESSESLTENMTLDEVVQNINPKDAGEDMPKNPGPCKAAKDPSQKTKCDADKCVRLHEEISNQPKLETETDTEYDDFDIQTQQRQLKPFGIRSMIQNMIDSGYQAQLIRNDDGSKIHRLSQKLKESQVKQSRGTQSDQQALGTMRKSKGSQVHGLKSPDTKNQRSPSRGSRLQAQEPALQGQSGEGMLESQRPPQVPEGLEGGSLPVPNDPDSDIPPDFYYGYYRPSPCANGNFCTEKKTVTPIWNEPTFPIVPHPFSTCGPPRRIIIPFTYEMLPVPVSSQDEGTQTTEPVVENPPSREQGIRRCKDIQYPCPPGKRKPVHDQHQSSEGPSELPYVTGQRSLTPGQYPSGQRSLSPGQYPPGQRSVSQTQYPPTQRQFNQGQFAPSERQLNQSQPPSSQWEPSQGQYPPGQRQTLQGPYLSEQRQPPGHSQGQLSTGQYPPFQGSLSQGQYPPNQARSQTDQGVYSSDQRPQQNSKTNVPYQRQSTYEQYLPALELSSKITQIRPHSAGKQFPSVSTQPLQSLNCGQFIIRNLAYRQDDQPLELCSSYLGKEQTCQTKYQRDGEPTDEGKYSSNETIPPQKGSYSPSQRLSQGGNYPSDRGQLPQLIRPPSIQGENRHQVQNLPLQGISFSPGQSPEIKVYPTQSERPLLKEKYTTMPNSRLYPDHIQLPPDPTQLFMATPDYGKRSPLRSERDPSWDTDNSRDDGIDVETSESTDTPAEIAPERSPQPPPPQPLTPQPLTPQSLTPQPLTPQPLTTQPLTPQPLTPQPLTPQPLTPKPLTPQPPYTTPQFERLTTFPTPTTLSQVSGGLYPSQNIVLDIASETPIEEEEEEVSTSLPPNLHEDHGTQTPPRSRHHSPTRPRSPNTKKRCQDLKTIEERPKDMFPIPAQSALLAFSSYVGQESAQHGPLFSTPCGRGANMPPCPAGSWRGTSCLPGFETGNVDGYEAKQSPAKMADEQSAGIMLQEDATVEAVGTVSSDSGSDMNTEHPQHPESPQPSQPPEETEVPVYTYRDPMCEPKCRPPILHKMDIASLGGKMSLKLVKRTFTGLGPDKMKCPKAPFQFQGEASRNDRRYILPEAKMKLSLEALQNPWFSRSMQGVCQQAPQYVDDRRCNPHCEVVPTRCRSESSTTTGCQTNTTIPGNYMYDGNEPRTFRSLRSVTHPSFREYKASQVSLTQTYSYTQIMPDVKQNWTEEDVVRRGPK